MISFDVRYQVTTWCTACEDPCSCPAAVSSTLCTLYNFDKIKDEVLYVGREKPSSCDILYVKQDSGNVAFLELKNRPIGRALDNFRNKINGSIKIARDDLQILPADIRGVFLAVSPEKNDLSQLRGRLRNYLSIHFTVLGNTIQNCIDGTEFRLRYALDLCGQDLNQEIEQVLSAPAEGKKLCQPVTN